MFNRTRGVRRLRLGKDTYTAVCMAVTAVVWRGGAEREGAAREGAEREGGGEGGGERGGERGGEERVRVCVCVRERVCVCVTESCCCD
jgi:hypothetical protein